MKLGTLFGIAAIGGFFYAHKQRGGEMTLDSVKETARSLFSAAQQWARNLSTPGTSSQRANDGDDADLLH